MTMAGAAWCVLRARFFRFEVRRFGTAMRTGPERSKVDPSGVGARFAQDGPAGICYGSTVALPGIAIGTTGGTKTLAIFPTERESGSGQKPFFANRWCKVELSCPCRYGVDIIFVCFVRAGLREQQMYFFRHGNCHVCETAAAFHGDRTFDPAAEVKATLTGAGKPALHGNPGFSRARIIVFPDRIRGSEQTVDVLGLRFEATYVKAQHSRER